jgi:hypothetical protein
MAGPGDTIRASDAERDAVIEMLRRHTADGRLTMAEFEERVAEALAARTRGDLDPVLRELPPLQPLTSPSRPPRAEPRWRSSAAALLPRIVPIIAVAAVAALLAFQGVWFAIFPLLWIIGGASRGGMACGSRHRSSRHAHGARHHPRHNETETIRV